MTSSSHVTTTWQVATSGGGEVEVVGSSDIVASLFIGSLLFIPVTIILCVTVVIRLRKSGMLRHAASCYAMLYVMSSAHFVFGQGSVLSFK